MAKQVTISADQFAKNWGQGMNQSVQKIQDGVNRVTESPMDKAIQRQDAYVQGVIAAAGSGKWASGLRMVSLADWKQKTSQKVGERLNGGVTAAAPKMQKFGTWLIGTLNTILPQIDSMPKQTLEDSIARSTAMIRAMAGNPYKK